MSNNKYEPTIGLEIHVELATKTKMFCGCAAGGNSKPNTRVCPICLGMPGTLPVPNKKAIEQVIMAGLALGAKIPERSKFDRKHYFYPDLPKGYQISQYDQPLCVGGELKCKVQSAKCKITTQNSKSRNDSDMSSVKIRRIHLEEDTGKLIHPKGENYSLVDYNRAGVPLMELVTEPCIYSAQEAKMFCQELRLVLRYLGISNADMEKGEMRCEANVSVRNSQQSTINNQQLGTKVKEGDCPRMGTVPESALGTKVEVKNLNSFRAVERAIEYEIERQQEVLNDGGKIVQETRGWNENKGETFSQRSKEEAQDYRYFPEPDIPSLTLGQNQNAKIKNQNDKSKCKKVIDVDKIKKSIPELPQEKRERFAEKYGLSEKDIEVLVANKKQAEWFEKIAKKAKNPKSIADWLVHRNGWHLKEEEILSIENKVAGGEISKNQAEEIIAKTKSGINVAEVIEKEGIKQVSDKGELEKIIKNIIIRNMDVVEKIKAGKTQARGFLVGEAMRATRGRANPEIVNQLLDKFLNE